MGIQVTNPDSMPAVTYDKIHMTQMQITQPIFDSDTQQPIYQVLINYRHYGVANGIRYYKNEEVQRVSLSDFIQTAMADAQQGDMTLINALQSIEVAVAAIISDQTGEETLVI